MQLKTWHKVVLAIVVPGGAAAGAYWIYQRFWGKDSGSKNETEPTAADKARTYADDLKQKALDLKQSQGQKATQGRG